MDSANREIAADSADGTDRSMSAVEIRGVFLTWLFPGRNTIGEERK